MRPRLLIVAAIVALVAGAAAIAASSSSKYTASVSYSETGHGTPQGESGAIKGITASGTFKGKLGGAARALAAKSGISLAQFAKGGSYKTKFDLSSEGKLTGVVKVTLKAPGVGTLCVKITASHGTFTPGSSFLPTSGTVTAAGGTGKAAKIRGSLSFDLKTVAGQSTEQFGVAGSAHSTSGSAKAPTACKSLT